MEVNPERGRLLKRLRDRGLWLNVAAAGNLLLLSLAVAMLYATQPQSPADFADRLTVLAGGDAFSPSMRSGERLLVRASRAEAVGADSLGEEFGWRAARAFARASAAAPGPRQEMEANDRLAGVYLRLGWRYLDRGRGGVFGVGGDTDALASAEGLAACVVGVAPTRRRAEVNTFVADLEEVLDRPLAGECPP
jgi:hypothetical protein